MNRRKYTEYEKKYRTIHKERINDYILNWLLTPKGIFSKIRNNSNFKKIRCDLTEDTFTKWYTSQKQECHYCHRTLDQCKKDNNKKNRRLTIDRKDNNIGYNLDNIVLACWNCNHIKSNYFTEQEMIKVGQIIREKELTI